MTLRTVVLFALAAVLSAPAAATPPAFEGKAVAHGKTFDLKYAWMVRGTSRLDPEKPKTYVILSTEDVSERIRHCENVTCAVWDAVRTGIVLEADGDGWWVLVLDPDRKPSQFSGGSVRGSGWTETARTPDRMAGTFVWRPAGDDPVFDFTVDAALLKAWEESAKK